MPVRDDGIPTINRWRTGKIAKTPTSLFNEDLQGRHVPGLDIRFEHDLGLATAHERIGKIVTKAALPSRRLRQALRSPSQ